MFNLRQINEWSADVKSAASLRGRYGNYTLLIRAQDLGTPSLQTEEALNICVTDYNDHPPEFISPPYNSTLKVPEVSVPGVPIVLVRPNLSETRGSKIFKLLKKFLVHSVQNDRLKLLAT